jgi:CelD/BcsL family acetyltransferase involved in cellulose biosynthesis
VNISVYTNPDVFEELEPEWNDLLHRSNTDVIFLTWEWQSSWWNAYEAGDLWIVTCRDDDGRLVAIGPWFIQDVDGERVVRTIGCVDVTDYVDIIAHKDCVEAVQVYFAHFFAENTRFFDRINLCNIPERSLTYISFPDRLRQHHFDADMVLQEVCPVIHLPSEWEGYLAMLDKKQRHEIRRKLRRAESEAELEWYVVGPEHDFEAEAEQFLKLMAASQPAKAEFLQDEKNLRFFRRILDVTFEKGWLKLSFLKVNGTPAAAYCDFDYNRQILVYNSGLLPEAYAHLSPGIVLLSYNIQNAIENQRTIFDFLRGNETYKYRMGAQDTRVYKLLARPDGADSREE